VTKEAERDIATGSAREWLESVKFITGRNAYDKRKRKSKNKCVLRGTMTVGDFNRHHSMWEPPENAHLCSNQAEHAAQPLIELLADHGMEQLLDAGVLSHDP
jgi:hypothetical protein